MMRPYPHLGRLVGKILAEAGRYDDDPMSANAPSECRAIAWRGSARRIREMAEAAGFESLRALDAEIDRRVGPKWAYQLGVSAVLDSIANEEEKS